MSKVVLDFTNLYRGTDVDEKYATLPMDVKTLADKVGRFILAIKKNNTLVNLFETTVAKRNQIYHLKREKLKREVSTRWVSEYESIDYLLYFKEKMVEVHKAFKTLSSTERKCIGISSITEYEWSHLKVLQGVVRIFAGPTKGKGLQGSTYVAIHATIPSVHFFLKKLNEMNTQDLRLNYSSISKGLIDAYAKLYKYYPIYDMDYGRMTRESFPRELIELIKADLDNLYMKYDKYYGHQEPPKSLEFSSPADHQYAILKSKDDYFFYLSDDDVFEEEDKEVAA